MQKEFAQPGSDKDNQLQFNQQSLPAIQQLNLNQQPFSIVQTNQDGQQQKQPCQQFVFEPIFSKRKPIDKKSAHILSQHTNFVSHPPSKIQRQRQRQRHQIKKKHNYQRKVEQLQNKIKQLQKQIHSLRRKQQTCPQCYYNFCEQQRSLRQIIIPQDYYRIDKHAQRLTDQAGTCQKNNSKDTVQFQQFNFLSPLMMSQQMEQKSWIFLGTMMIAMGSKIMDIDGTLNVFKVLKQSVDSLRRQVQKCQQKINMDFFLSKQQFQITNDPFNSNIQAMGLNFDPFFAKHEQHPAGGFQLQGVKLQSVQQYELIYDQKIKFSVKYQALITVMEYLRNHCSLQ